MQTIKQHPQTTNKKNTWANNFVSLFAVVLCLSSVVGVLCCYVFAVFVYLFCPFLFSLRVWYVSVCFCAAYLSSRFIACCCIICALFCAISVLIRCLCLFTAFSSFLWPLLFHATWPSHLGHVSICSYESQGYYNNNNNNNNNNNSYWVLESCFDPRYLATSRGACQYLLQQKLGVLGSCITPRYWAMSGGACQHLLERKLSILESNEWLVSLHASRS